MPAPSRGLDPGTRVAVLLRLHGARGFDEEFGQGAVLSCAGGDQGVAGRFEECVECSCSECWTKKSVLRRVSWHCVLSSVQGVSKRLAGVEAFRDVFRLLKELEGVFSGARV